MTLKETNVKKKKREERRRRRGFTARRKE